LFEINFRSIIGILITAESSSTLMGPTAIVIVASPDDAQPDRNINIRNPIPPG
jgi:hypothetical protein